MRSPTSCRPPTSPDGTALMSADAPSPIKVVARAMARRLRRHLADEERRRHGSAEHGTNAIKVVAALLRAQGSDMDNSGTSAADTARSPEQAEDAIPLIFNPKTYGCGSRARGMNPTSTSSRWLVSGLGAPRHPLSSHCCTGMACYRRERLPPSWESSGRWRNTRTRT
jgi:hypothetical protein